MNNLVTTTIDCLKDGKVIASYRFDYHAGAELAPTSTKSLIDDAKTQLTNERLAFPPYEGITFRVR